MKKSLKIAMLFTVLSLILSSCKTGIQNSSVFESLNSTSSTSSENISDSSIYSSDMLSENVSGVITSVESMNSISSSDSSTKSTAGLSTNPSSQYNTNWAGDKFMIQDLGAMQLNSYPDDINYDWAFSVMKMGDTYKMWWTRQSPHDTIWYAESKDLKNWSKEQRILKIDKDSTWIKMHIARPTVVYANSKYHMYFEAPATNETNYGEYDNNVFLATSTDGIKFTLYPNNANPVPIIKQPSDSMNKRKYGIGQPTAFYKDGKYVLYYTDAINGDGMKVATSTDGINFGKYESHPRVFDRAAVGVKYNSLTKKYMMLYSVDPSNWDKSLTRDEKVFYMESNDGITWPYKTVESGSKNPNVFSSNKSKIRGYPDFVTNPQGIVDTPTMYVTYMEGELAPLGSDWKTNYTTWNGHIVAVNPKMYTNKPIVLPNQKVTSSSNLLLYKDNTIKLTKQSSSAKFTNTSPKIDGNIDSMWNSASELKIQRQVSNWGLVPTATNGTAKLLWDNNFLYALIQVKDLKISYSYKGGLGDMWRRDSVDVFVDVPNDHKTIPSLWTPKQYLMSVCVNGEFLVKGSQDVDITDDFTGIQKSVKMVSGGYIVEIKLPWHPLVKGLVSDNRVIGVDMQINDDKGSGDRDSMVVWNDRTGNAFRWSDVLGDIKLIK